MMRASVLIFLAPTVIGVAGCRDNPGFLFTSNSAGIDGSADDATADDDATAGDSSGETSVVACSPIAFKDVPDVCADWAPFPGVLPNFSAFFDACEGDADIHVKRSGDSLVACSNADCSTCDMNRSITIGPGSTAATTLGNLLPRDQSCSRFVHRGAVLPDSESSDPCNSIAYALLDPDEPAKLRFAIAYKDADPFVDLLPELALTVDADASASCPDGTMDSCTSVVPLDLEFSFADCHIPAAVQGAVWRDISVDGADYEFEVRSAFQCLDDSRLGINWFLRLVQ